MASQEPAVVEALLTRRHIALKFQLVLVRHQVHWSGSSDDSLQMYRIVRTLQIALPGKGGRAPRQRTGNDGGVGVLSSGSRRLLSERCRHDAGRQHRRAFRTGRQCLRRWSRRLRLGVGICSRRAFARISRRREHDSRVAGVPFLGRQYMAR